MDFLSTFHLKQWVNDNQHLFAPPFRTNKLLVTHKDFIVMMLRGQNTRVEFHNDAGAEIIYQVEGARRDDPIEPVGYLVDNLVLLVRNTPSPTYKTVIAHVSLPRRS